MLMLLAAEGVEGTVLTITLPSILVVLLARELLNWLSRKKQERQDGGGRSAQSECVLCRSRVKEIHGMSGQTNQDMSRVREDWREVSSAVIKTAATMETVKVALEKNTAATDKLASSFTTISELLHRMFYTEIPARELRRNAKGVKDGG